MARHDLGRVYRGGETETARNRSRHTERNRQIKRQNCFNIQITNMHTDHNRYTVSLSSELAFSLGKGCRDLSKYPSE